MNFNRHLHGASLSLSLPPSHSPTHANTVRKYQNKQYLNLIQKLSRFLPSLTHPLTLSLSLARSRYFQSNEIAQVYDEEVQQKKPKFLYAFCEKVFSSFFLAFFSGKACRFLFFLTMRGRGRVWRNVLITFWMSVH